jgi:hypothetical protein
MPKVTVKLEGAEELQAAIMQLDRAVRGSTIERAGLAGAEVIRDLARGKAPGPYVDLEVPRQSDVAIEYGIGPDAEHWYYGFLETGVKPHSFGPASKKALAFAGSEGEQVVIRVDHPGFPADPFLRPAIDGGKEEATAEAGRVLKAAIEAVAKG